MSVGQRIDVALERASITPNPSGPNIRSFYEPCVKSLLECFEAELDSYVTKRLDHK